MHVASGETASGRQKDSVNRASGRLTRGVQQALTGIDTRRGTECCAVTFHRHDGCHHLIRGGGGTSMGNLFTGVQIQGTS